MRRYLSTFCLLGFSIVLAEELAPITVLSTKLEKSIVDNAHTIDIINRDTIEISDSKSIKDISAILPNTNISGRGNRDYNTFTLRGISNYVTTESSVAIYVDDVPIPFSYGFGLIDMYDIESLEVLKGAQGTLFGKGAQSGVINIYTNPPTDEFKGKISAGYGAYNSKEFYGFSSGGTGVDNLNYAISITKNSTDGYTNTLLSDNHFDYRDFLSFNAKLNYKLTDELDVTLKYSKSISDDGGSPYKTDIKEFPTDVDEGSVDDYLKMRSDILSLIIKYEDSNTLFTSSSSISHQSVEKLNYIALLGGIDIATDIDIEEITQEFRYRYKFENSDLMIGAFYSDKTQFDYKENQTLLAVPLSSLNSLTNPDKNMALFTQYRYYISDKYSIMAGVRYQETKRSFDRVLNDFGATPTNANATKTWTHILPTISISYEEEDSHTYFTYSKGYRPGGYIYRSSDVIVPFKPEVSDSYEIGYKKIWDNIWTLNSALFYNDITDHRINTFTDTFGSIVLNADKAYSYGAELSLNYKKDNLLLYSSFGWTEAKYEKFTTDSKYENNKLIEVPNITASIGAKYDFNSHLYISSSIKYMGERYYDVANTTKIDGYTAVNIKAGYNYNNW